MIPFFIGSGERPVYAVLTPASGTRQRRAVVFCPPFGKEYVRTHRTARVLADRLAERGQDVLRFDYYGTGDSGGDDDELTLAGAATDARDAVVEALAVSGVRAVTLIGLRHGAAAALLAADATPGRSVDRLVLWDPVITGLRPSAIRRDTLMIVSEDSPAYRAEFQCLVGGTAQLATYVVSPSAPSWVARDIDGIGPTPVALLGRIASWTP